jgi:hypothetical protein
MLIKLMVINYLDTFCWFVAFCEIFHGLLSILENFYHFFHDPPSFQYSISFTQITIKQMHDFLFRLWIYCILHIYFVRRNGLLWELGMEWFEDGGYETHFWGIFKGNWVLRNERCFLMAENFLCCLMNLWGW